MPDSPGHQKISWWHSIDLGDGEVTPGYKDPVRLAAELDALQLPDLAGKQVLDVGAWDGFLSFSAERLGAARVVALNYHSWVGAAGRAGFDYARRRLDSSVQPVTTDFMTVDLEELGTFDITLFLGVLYHLTNPMFGLERLAAVTGGSAFIETEAIELVGYPAAKLCEFYESTELAGDPSNWWAPTGNALTAMCRAAGFARAELIAGLPADLGGAPRIVHYRAVCRADR